MNHQSDLDLFHLRINLTVVNLFYMHLDPSNVAIASCSASHITRGHSRSGITHATYSGGPDFESCPGD
jgi:hypothetical protein